VAVEKVSARDWVVEINTGTVAVPAWTQIGGINNFVIGRNDEETDTTDFDSGGMEEHHVMQRGKTLGLEGFFKEDPANGDRDAGQEAVEAHAELVGAASLKQYRFTSPGGTGKVAMFSAKIGSVGGGNNDKTSWAVELKRSGAEAAAA
jgi:hypothetical protein